MEMLESPQTELVLGTHPIAGSAKGSALEHWFTERVGRPTPIQQHAWPIVRAGQHAVLLSATGQGKSLAAWLPLVERTISNVSTEGRLQVLHIAPLKALASDMTHNLQPLMLAASAIAGRSIKMEVRSGDTTAYERDRQLRKPPDYLATTPETLFILLGSARARRLLGTVKTVIIDEIHALAQGKRGAHLLLSLERLDQIAERPVQRIGLSATARPADRLAGFLCGRQGVHVVNADQQHSPSVLIESLPSRLGPFPHHGHWQQVHERIVEIISDEIRPSAGMLVFCSTRAQVERTAAALSERLGTGQVGAHHGSLDKTHRERIEQRFRQGELTVIVSSASLELGLDLGDIDRICQIGRIGSVNQLRQRAGRSGHRPGARPIAHVFPLTNNQWLEAEAAAEAIVQGEIEATEWIDQPLDVMVQHLVAMVSSQGTAGQATDDEWFDLIRSAYPWRNLKRSDFDAVVELLLSQDVSTGGGAAPLLFRNPQGYLQAQQNTSRLVLTNAGVIPEWFQYDVFNASDQQFLGQLDEEFAFESSVGDVIQLGNRPFQLVCTRPGKIYVEEYEGDAVQVPFWFGDGASRSAELSKRLLSRFTLDQVSPTVRDWLMRTQAALGALPTMDRLLIERFRDPNGDRHLVIHTFAGARLNRAWGLALRKRFCRQFNFELQAAATDDGILISIGMGSQFEVEAIVRFVTSQTARSVLIQALLDTPLFVTRFRWCANSALSVLRFDDSGPVSPQIQRNRTENLIEQVFPDQLACLENLSGPREVPDHPLIQQTLADCLHEHMDIDGLERLLERIETNEIEVIAVDLDEPSPLAESLIHAPPHSFLDEEAAEERRTRSFESRPGSPFSAAPVKLTEHPANPDAGKPKPPVYQGTQALLDLLDQVGYLTRAEGEAGISFHGQCVPGGWASAFQALIAKREAFAVSINRDRCLWVSRTNVAALQRVLPGAQIRPWLSASLMPKAEQEFDQALMQLIQARINVFDRVDPAPIADELMCSHQRVDEVLDRLDRQFQKLGV